MSTKIIPADQPAYYADHSGIVLMGEFSRTVPVDCHECGYGQTFKLVADEILADIECDSLLDDHLRSLGWSVDSKDVCPACTGSYT